MRLFDHISPGNRVEIVGWQSRAMNVVALVLIVYSIWYALFGVTNRHFNASVFAGVLATIVFLTTTRNRLRNHIDIGDRILALLSAIVFAYFALNDNFYQTLMQGMTPIPWYESLAGLMAIGLTFEACRRSIGWGLTSVMGLLLIYAGLGQYLPGALSHPSIDLPYFITIQTVTTEGLFGPALEVAATYAILFITYGTFFQRTGGGEMFFQMAAALIGRSSGGASKACVVSSGLYGSISGSPVADVVTTGPLTIPLMKRMGVAPFRAAGIEAAASSGGALLPPVMGAVAFLMVEFTAIPYHAIAAAATIPALLYYLGVLYGTHLESQRRGEAELETEEKYNIVKTLVRYWRHMVSIIVMCTLLALEYSAAYVAAASLVTVIVMSWTDTRRERRIGIFTILECSGETVRQIATLTAAVMASGVIIGCITLTGMTGKFSILISALGGGQLEGVLFVSAVLMVILGMGMPTASVYILGVALIAPILVQVFKVPILQTHMFMVFFSCLSAITPPLAVACFAAASIAGADPMRTGVYACKLGFAGFVVPFFFVAHPGVLLVGDSGQMALDIVAGTILVFAAAWALFGRGMKQELPVILRLVLGALCIALVLPSSILQLAAGGAIICIGAVLFVFRVRPVAASV